MHVAAAMDRRFVCNHCSLITSSSKTKKRMVYKIIADLRSTVRAFLCVLRSHATRLGWRSFAGFVHRVAAARKDSSSA